MKANLHRYLAILAAAILALLLLSGCGSKNTKLRETAEEQYQYAMKQYTDRHYLKAIDGFQKVIFNFSGASMVDSAQYFLAMSYYRMNDFYLAATEFDRLVANYPGSGFIDDGQYMRGACYFKSAPANYGLDQAETEQAVEILEDFIVDHPESEMIGEAKKLLALAKDRLARKKYESGRVYYRLSYYDAAKTYFQAVIDDYTDSEWAPRALYYQGEIDYKLKKYDEAKTKFNHFLVVYSNHEYAAKARKMIVRIDNKLAQIAKNN